MSYVDEFSFFPPFKFLYCVNTVTQIYHTYQAAFMCFFLQFLMHHHCVGLAYPTHTLLIAFKVKLSD